MGIIIFLLTVVLVLTCGFLILLVLIQLPKKETGAGLAFGAGATDALFGAGSGNVLTKVTKYAAGIFLVLAMLLSVLNINHATTKRGTGGVQKLLDKASQIPLATPTAPPQAATPPASPATNVIGNLAPVTLPQSTPAPATAPAPAQPEPVKK